MTTLTEFKEIETPLLKFLRYFRDEKATGTLAYDELQHHIAEYTALIAVAEGMAEHASRVMELLEKHGSGIVPHLMDTDENAGESLRQALAAYEAWKLNIEGEK